MIARAPAKAILSGEHAVLYGMPALALALPRFAQVRISVIAAADGTDRPIPGVGHPPACQLLLRDVDQRCSIDLSRLDQFADQCQQRHRRFNAAQLPIEAVLPKPADLYHYALSTLPGAAEALAGCQVELSSDIPIGSGMGSSAATVAALLTAVAGWQDTALTVAQLTELTTRCEMLQHGRSSGLDPAICARGGLVRFQQGGISSLPAVLDRHWYLIDSGRPAGTTGRCASEVKRRFGDSAIWSEFGDITQQLGQALQQQDSELIRTSLRHNHRLLCRIGVVPEPVQRLIQALEQNGGAAKISGSGAVSGDRGGLVLVYCAAEAKSWLAGCGYSWQKLEMDHHGAQLRD